MKKRIRRKLKQIPSKSKLKLLYVKEGKSLREIGKIFATNPLRIRKILVGYGIKISKRGAWASGLTKETHDGIRRSAESKRGVPRGPETRKKG